MNKWLVAGDNESTQVTNEQNAIEDLPPHSRDQGGWTEVDLKPSHRTQIEEGRSIQAAILLSTASSREGSRPTLINAVVSVELISIKFKIDPTDATAILTICEHACACFKISSEGSAILLLTRTAEISFQDWAKENMISREGRALPPTWCRLNRTSISKISTIPAVATSVCP